MASRAETRFGALFAGISAGDRRVTAAVGMIIGLGVVGLTLVGHAWIGAAPRYHHPVAWSLLVGIVAAAGLVVAAWRPLLGVAVTATGLVGEAVLRREHLLRPGPDWVLVAFAICIAWAVHQRATSRRAVVGIALAAIMVAFADIVLLGLGFHRYGDLLTRPTLVVAAVATGLYVATRTAFVAALKDRAERLEHERELATDRAIVAERLRIARELHDIVSHTLTLMVVQASAVGAQLGPEHPLHESIEAAAETGRQALQETRRMLGVLRMSESAPLAPQPGVSQLPTLVDAVRSTGIEVTLVEHGVDGRLPAALALTVYRIVQEALTNTVRHANATSAVVTVEVDPQCVVASVMDDGSSPAGAPAPGHGITGMRERAQLFAGTVEAGPLDGGGWLVRATLLRESDSAIEETQ